MEYIKLSEIKVIENKYLLIDYLLENNYIGIINDINGNNIKYDLSDLLLVWDNIYNKLLKNKK